MAISRVAIWAAGIAYGRLLARSKSDTLLVGGETGKIAMSDKKGATVVVRGLSIVLMLFALGMLAARQFGGLDLSPVVAMGMLTVGIALMAVAQSSGKKSD
jgi:hypothetical protein